VLCAAQEDEEKSLKMGNHLMAPRETSPRERSVPERREKPRMSCGLRIMLAERVPKWHLWQKKETKKTETK